MIVMEAAMDNFTLPTVADNPNKMTSIRRKGKLIAVRSK
jgi:hypothetical protein